MLCMDDRFHEDRHRRDFQQESSLQQDSHSFSTNKYANKHPELSGVSLFDETVKPLKDKLIFFGKIQIAITIIAMMIVLCVILSLFTLAR